MKTGISIFFHFDMILREFVEFRQLMKRDYFVLLNDFSAEFGVKPSELIGPRELKIQKIAAENQTDISAKIKSKILLHQKKWELAKKQPGFSESREK